MIIGGLLALAAGAVFFISTAPMWAFVFGTIGTAIAFACAFMMAFLV
jgi:hypothetical protein